MRYTILFLLFVLSFVLGIPVYAKDVKKPVQKKSTIAQTKKPLSSNKKPTTQPVPSKPPLQNSTVTKAKDLLKKLDALKKIEPAKVKPIKNQKKQPTVKTILDQPTKDKPVRDYYKDHPGSYGPPLLKYNLPTGL